MDADRGLLLHLGLELDLLRARMVSAAAGAAAVAESHPTRSVCPSRGRRRTWPPCRHASPNSGGEDVGLIVERMSEHQRKKNPLLRRLHAWR